MGDFLGQFTCHTYNCASVVDYVIGSHDLQSSINNFSIGNFNEFSHHSCLSFVMRVNISVRSGDDIELTHHPKSFAWDPSMSNCLRDVINSDEVQNKLNSLFTDKTSYNVDHLVDEFTEILSDSCHRFYHLKSKRKLKKHVKAKSKVVQ